MKPTSIIFIILAAVLIVAGVVLCLVGNSMTSDQAPLLCTRVEDGNDITEHSLAEYDLSSVDINLENVNVVIRGNSARNYVEFVNINKLNYSFVINDHKLEISSVNPFNVSSMLKFRENSGGFDGLRHYLFLNKYKGKEARINIYITPDSKLKDIKVNTKNGSITVENVDRSAKYELASENADVIIKDVTTRDNVSVNIKKGNLRLELVNLKKLNFVIENGNGEFKLDRQYTYKCQCVNGSIILDGSNYNDSYNKAYPIVGVTDVEAPAGETVEGEAPAAEAATGEAATGEAADTEAETSTQIGEIEGKITSGDLKVVIVTQE